MNIDKDAKPSLKIPKLPGYVFTETLGSGSYATVFKALENENKKTVAVKCVSKASLNHTSKENLLTEIEVMKTLKHKNIVELKGFHWDDAFIYLILEYCSGGDLMSFLKINKVVSQRIAKKFIQQLATGLDYLRSKSVCHMDLKPSNLLLSSKCDPTLKIADFGFAHYLKGTTESMFLRGSLLYMAPEIITKGVYDEKADLWSVGVILYECLFGRAPFASRTMSELERKIISHEPIEIPPFQSSSSSSISESCLNLLNGLLKRDPVERMGYDEFLAHPFVDFIHRPTKHSYHTATTLVNQAVSMDTKGDYISALEYYCDAIEYFMAAIQYETMEVKKKLIRAEVNRHISRAEEIKKMLNSSDTASSTTATTTSPLTTSTTTSSAIFPTSTLKKLTAKTSTTTLDKTLESSNIPNNDKIYMVAPFDEDSFTILSELYKNNDQMVKTLQVIKSAESKVKLEDYKSAFERYEAGLGMLLKLSQDIPSGPEKDLLKSQISNWMSRAEWIKKYLIINKEISCRKKDFDDLDDSKYYNCSIS